jgi:hypothetical protein
MQAGMVVSNEPGYYEEGAFGIRIENLVAAREADTPFKFGDVPYLSFERLTLVPFQRKLMDLQVFLISVNDQHKALVDECLFAGCPSDMRRQTVHLRVQDSCSWPEGRAERHGGRFKY